MFYHIVVLAVLSTAAETCCRESFANTERNNYYKDNVAVQIFGPSGHAVKPEGSTLSSYTNCYPEQDPENRHVKSIVNMDFVYQPGRDPHHFKYYVSLHLTQG